MIAYIILAVIIVIIIMKYIIYKYTGWTKFTMFYRQNFMVNTDPENVPKIKFSDCIFRVISTQGQEKSVNVTNTLNRMVSAYDGNMDSRYKFKLADPGLNSASFVLPNVTDPNIIRSVGDFPIDWKNTENVTLTGYYKLLN
jgi:hypothetical protein